MNGALPPSSSDSFFSVSAEARARCLPTGVEPVKVILRTRASASHTSTTSGVRSREAVTMLIVPAGKPASSARRTSASEVSGVSSAGLATTVQPAASAGAILRAIIAAGKFHGVIAATTPTGSLTAIMLRPRTGAGNHVAVGAGRLLGEPLDVARARTAPRRAPSASGLPCSREISAPEVFLVRDDQRRSSA